MMGNSHNMSLEKYNGEAAGKEWQRGRLEMVARHTSLIKNEKFLWDLLEMHCTFDPWMAIGVKCPFYIDPVGRDNILITWKGYFLDYKEQEFTAPLPFVTASLIPLNQFRLKATAEPEWFRNYMNEMEHNDLIGQRFDPAIVLERANLTYGADHRTWVKKNHERMKLYELYDYRNDISFNDTDNMDWQRQKYNDIKKSSFLWYDKMLEELFSTHLTLDIWKAVGRKFDPIFEVEKIPDEVTFQIIEYREALIGCPQWAINSLLDILHQIQSHIRINPRWFRGYLKEMGRLQLFGIRFQPEILYGNKTADEADADVKLVILNHKLMTDREKGKKNLHLKDLIDQDGEDEEDGGDGEEYEEEEMNEQDGNDDENGSGDENIAGIALEKEM